MNEFTREGRYIVIKPDCQDSLRTERLRNYIEEMCFITPDCVVVEADWPEYELVWSMIERRIAGLPNELDTQRLRADTAERALANCNLALKAQTFNFETQKAKVTAAEQRIAELERDAARYRWLRNPEQRDCVPPELDVICGVAEGEDVLWFEQLDRTIDAALNPNPEAESHE